MDCNGTMASILISPRSSGALLRGSYHNRVQYNDCKLLSEMSREMLLLLELFLLYAHHLLPLQFAPHKPNHVLSPVMLSLSYHFVFRSLKISRLLLSVLI